MRTGVQIVLLAALWALDCVKGSPYAHAPLHHTVSRRYNTHEDAIASGILQKMVSRRFGTFPHLFAHSRENNREIKHSFEGVDATGHVVQSRMHAVTRRDLYMLEFYPEVTRLQCGGPNVLVTVTDATVTEAWEVGGMLVTGHRLACEDDGPTTIRVETEKGTADPIEVPEGTVLPMYRIIRHKTVLSATQVLLVTESTHFLDAFEQAAVSHRVFSPHHALRRHVPEEEEEEFTRSRMLLRNRTVEAGLDHDFVFAPHHAHVHHMHWGEGVLCKGCPAGHMPSPEHLRPGTGREATTPAHLRRRSDAEESARHMRWAKRYGSTRWKRRGNDSLLHEPVALHPMHALRSRELHGSPVFLDMTPGDGAVLWDDDDDDDDDGDDDDGDRKVAQEGRLRGPDEARFAQRNNNRKQRRDAQAARRRQEREREEEEDCKEDAGSHHAEFGETVGWNVKQGGAPDQASLPVLFFEGVATPTSADFSVASIEGELQVFGRGLSELMIHEAAGLTVEDSWMPLTKDTFEFSPVPIPEWMRSMIEGQDEVEASLEITCENCYIKAAFKAEFDYTIKCEADGDKVRDIVTTFTRENDIRIELKTTATFAFNSPKVEAGGEYDDAFGGLNIPLPSLVPLNVWFQSKTEAELFASIGVSGSVSLGVEMSSGKQVLAYSAALADGSVTARQVGNPDTKGSTDATAPSDGIKGIFKVEGEVFASVTMGFTPGIRIILSLAKVPMTDYSAFDFVLQLEPTLEVVHKFSPHMSQSSPCCAANVPQCDNGKFMIQQKMEASVDAAVTVLIGAFAFMGRIDDVIESRPSPSQHGLLWVDLESAAAVLGPIVFMVVPNENMIKKEDLEKRIAAMIEGVTPLKGGCWGPYEGDNEHKECFNKNGIIAQCEEEEQGYSSSWGEAKFCKALEHNGIFAKSGEEPGKAACVTLMGSTCEEQCTTISPLFNSPGDVTMSACHACLASGTCDPAKDPGGAVPVELVGCEASEPKFKQPEEVMVEPMGAIKMTKPEGFTNSNDEEPADPASFVRKHTDLVVSNDQFPELTRTNVRVPVKIGKPILDVWLTPELDGGITMHYDRGDGSVTSVHVASLQEATHSELFAYVARFARWENGTKIVVPPE